MNEHKHGKCILKVEVNTDKIEITLKGKKADLIHALAHAMDSDKDFENVVLDTMQVLATNRIMNLVEKAKVEKELALGKKVKN